MVTNEQILKRLVKNNVNNNMREIKKLKLLEIGFERIGILYNKTIEGNNNIDKMVNISELSKESIDNMFNTVKVLEAMSKSETRRTKHLETELDKATSAISRLMIENNRLKLNRFIYKMEGMIAGIAIISIIYFMIVR